MSEFPQPTPAPIFNPTDYPQIAALGLSFPNAQGAENWFQDGNAVQISGSNLTYNGTTVSWANLQTKVQAIAALSQASNSTTLNVNNTVQVQYGETTDPPTQTIVISSDASGNRLALDGDYGAVGSVLVSGGDNGNLVWGSGGGALVGTLGEVLNNGNIASKNLDMNGYMIENAILELDSLNIATDPVPSPILTSAGSVIPIILNGATYYIQLFSVPP